MDDVVTETIKKAMHRSILDQFLKTKASSARNIMFTSLLILIKQIS